MCCDTIICGDLSIVVGSKPKSHDSKYDQYVIKFGGQDGRITWPYYTKAAIEQAFSRWKTRYRNDIRIPILA